MGKILKKKILDAFFITLPSVILLLFVICFKYFPQTLSYDKAISQGINIKESPKTHNNVVLENLNSNIKDIIDDSKEYMIVISKGAIEVVDMDGKYVYTVKAFPEEFPKDDTALLEKGIPNLSASKLVEIVNYLES